MTVCDWPSRWNVTPTLVPGVVDRMASSSAFPFATGCPPNRTITSPARIPASAAGPPGETAVLLPVIWAPVPPQPTLIAAPSTAWVE